MPGARQGRAPLLPTESGNEEMMLPLTLEIQMRAMARTLLRGAGACRQRISPAQRRQGSSARAQRKRHVSEGYGRAVRLWLKPVIGHAMHMAMAVANSRTNCTQSPLRRQRSQLWRDQLWRTRIEGEACQGQGRAEPAEHKRARQKLTAFACAGACIMRRRQASLANNGCLVRAAGLKISSELKNLIGRKVACFGPLCLSSDSTRCQAVSYTHLTLPTKRIV